MSTVARARELRRGERPCVCTTAIRCRIAVLLRSTLDQVRQSSLDAAKATGEYAKQQEQLEDVQKRAEKATSDLATATGRARVEALANAKALREEARQALFNAKAKAEAARQTARLRSIDAQEEVRKTRAVGGALTRDQFGGTGIAIEGPSQKAAQEAQNNLRAANKAVKDAQGILKGVPGSVELLNAKIISTQPVVSFDWSPDKEGLACMACLDQSLRVMIVTKLHLY